ncbi:MAG: hypothetical protein JRH19_01010 [Deltaproteobacteria bacterium]|nr:hypothetical protein [Deltaproteobacteria bacterium]
MPPPKLSILLGISILLWLPPTTAAADEELATAAELARLSASQRELQAELDARLLSQVDALIEEQVGRALADRTTQLLRRQNRLAALGGEGPPAAMPAVTDGRPSSPVQPAPNTTCTMVGRDFECVLRDVASR